MLLQAIRELEIDPASSFLIGDGARDCAAAAAAGVASHLFTGSDLLNFVRGIVASEPDSLDQVRTES
jgi:D-glycero-D-manno-heptose 1,7-bisphosphate phosphatase